ncbi:MAG: glycosyltransferase family 2 protein [Saprospiraceae bacterium]|nr:glycosyltransferase family 2 protein [Saprospiraceae bacterium]
MTNNQKILFSIIIPSYNRANMISKAILSVLDQTYTDWELIIVDDGSTDNTSEVVNSFDDIRIKYFYKDHEERSIARNFGIEKAAGTYISFLDDDDYYLPEFLEEFNKKILVENCPVAVFMSEELIQSGEKIIEKKFSDKLLDNKIRLIWNYEPGIRPFVLHKNIFKIYNFKIGLNYGQDLNLIIRIAMNFRIYLIKFPLYVFYWHDDQGVKTKFKKNISYNAENAIMSLNELISKNPSITHFIPLTELFDKVNHQAYGYASASMKNGDFMLFFKLIRKFSFKGSKLKLGYRLISLLSRLPYYWLKNI